MFNFLAPVGTQLGYGKVGLNIIKRAIETGKDISYFPLYSSIEDILKNSEPQYHSIIIQAYNNAAKFNGLNPSVRLWHQFDMAQHVGYPRIGWPIFELNKFNELEKHHLSQCDWLIVCSHWAKNIVNQEIPNKPCYIANLGVDKKIYYPADKTNPNKFVFLNIGKWEYRKGHDILLSVFQKAFPKEDNVELWMSCDNPFIDNSLWINQYKSDPRVRIIPRMQTQEELVNVIHQANCGVFLSRAEGWGLGLTEMLACGKSCITTACTAHTDFCNTYNSMLVDIDDTEIAVDNIWFHGQGSWAKLGNRQIDQAVEHMRTIYNNPKLFECKDLVPNLSWDNTLGDVLHACGY